MKTCCKDCCCKQKAIKVDQGKLEELISLIISIYDHRYNLYGPVEEIDDYISRIVNLEKCAKELEKDIRL